MVRNIFSEEVHGTIKEIVNEQRTYTVNSWCKMARLLHSYNNSLSITSHHECCLRNFTQSYHNYMDEGLKC